MGGIWFGIDRRLCLLKFFCFFVKSGIFEYVVYVFLNLLIFGFLFFRLGLGFSFFIFYIFRVVFFGGLVID